MMATVKIRDDVIWIGHIEGAPALQDRLRVLRAGAVLDLEVDGVVGQWERMRDGVNGVPTPGIKPISHMKQVWAEMRKRTGDVVPIREVQTAQSYLHAVAATLDEWSSPEDEAAYADL
nr:hypothetical protein [uncultured Devosia sp.]